MTNTANKTVLTPLQQFHTSAVAHKLSAGAILLWQYVYFTAQAQNKYANLHLRTAEVLEALSITRNGLQKIRRNLVNAGLLKVRIDARQQVYYTLMIDGEIVNHDEKTNSKSSPSKPKTNGTGLAQKSAQVRPPTVISMGNAVGEGSPLPNTYKPYAPKYVANSGDILQNNAYRKLIDAFCTQHDAVGNAGLSIRLQQFLYRRKQQGKTLTQAGLDALLDKLATLAEQNVHAMISIIQQSITRGWYGFYPYKPVAAYCGTGHPSGTDNNNPWRSKPSRIPNYDTKKEDLDFLEW